VKMIDAGMLVLAGSVVLATTVGARHEALQAGTNAAQSPVAAATPTAEAPSVVYVYRYKQFMGSGLEPSVYSDDVELARMDNGRYFGVTLPPGTHTFRSNDKQSGVVLTTKPGERYFLRIEIASGLMKGHGRLLLVQPEQGAFEITKLKPLGSDKVRDKARVSVLPFEVVGKDR
jgi:hypothetical protein